MGSLLRPSTTHHGGLIPVLPRSSFGGTGCVFQSLLLPAVSSSSNSIQCFAISRPRTQDHVDVIQNGLPVIKWQDIVEDDTERDIHMEPISQLVDSIRSMLKSMDDGEITVSPYDTAWVALVEDGGGPQFPSSLEWISNNQLEDGSWGDAACFSIYDRIINTLACVVALRSWNLHPHQSTKGIVFIKENMNKLGDEDEVHMPIGFEVALPSLIEMAKKVDIEIPYDSPALKEIYAKRDLKLTRIPREMMQQVPTTLLHSLEGMSSLNWEKLIKLQSSDGSFLFSPSSTAFALQQIRDDNCLRYLSKHVHKFNGGVPNVYPVDLFEHIWAVDRLQRLGISRYFQTEIEECIAYVHRFWTNKGICWARNSEVQDIDDTAMGFRLLRMHGYEVTPDVFKHFEKGGEFFCFAGQSNQAVTGMYNLYRASQLMFPDEDILAQASKFSAKFLQEKRARNELLDKWIITKDLPGEVGYALDVPWYASLPRLEARFYLEQYGGEDDVWIGKTLYRMPYVNNNTYLELAKLDYNNCQAFHQMEWKSIQKWYRNFDLGEFGLSGESLLKGYYLVAANVFEPEKSHQRLAWAKTATLVETIESHFERIQASREQKSDFVKEFEHGSILKYTSGVRYKTRISLVGTLVRTLNRLSLDVLLAHGTDIYQKLNHAWLKWLRTWEQGEDIGEGNAELLVSTLNLCGGYKNINNNNNHILNDGDDKEDEGNDKLLFSSHPKYQQLLKLTNKVCHQLRSVQRKRKVFDDGNNNGCVADMGGIKNNCQIKSDMQELVKLVLTKSSSNDLDSDIKQSFLTVARSFYYSAYCSSVAMDSHVNKVLFERVL